MREAGACGPAACPDRHGGDGDRPHAARVRLPERGAGGGLERRRPDPVGPSGAAAAFDRDAFLAVGGFDENLFAYLEDVDLVLRMRLDGGRCRLAPDARGVHEHSGTLQSGSARKDYLMGFGRGYMLRKWGVLTARRLPPVLIRELVICAGQAASIATWPVCEEGSTACAPRPRRGRTPPRPCAIRRRRWALLWRAAGVGGHGYERLRSSARRCARAYAASVAEIFPAMERKPRPRLQRADAGSANVNDRGPRLLAPARPQDHGPRALWDAEWLKLGREAPSADPDVRTRSGGPDLQPGIGDLEASAGSTRALECPAAVADAIGAAGPWLVEGEVVGLQQRPIGLAPPELGAGRDLPRARGRAAVAIEGVEIGDRRDPKARTADVEDVMTAGQVGDRFEGEPRFEAAARCRARLAGRRRRYGSAVPARAC